MVDNDLSESLIAHVRIMFSEFRYPRFDSRCVAHTDADCTSHLPADEMLRQEAAPAAQYHSSEGTVTFKVY